MEPLGVLRRIDELGRIVIPKGIRSRLHINEGDSLELLVSDSQELIVTKYNSFKGNDETINAITSSLARELSLQIVIINSEMVLSHSKDSSHEMIGKRINPLLLGKLNERKMVVMNNERIINSSDPYNFIMFPIAKNSETLGGIIILDKQSVTEEEIKIINIFRNIITNIIKV